LVSPHISGIDFDGYGFDPVTMLSCPPLPNDNLADETIDTANNIQDTGTTESADAPEDSTDSSINRGHAYFII